MPKLIDYLDYWLNTFKKKSVKESTFDRLLTAYNALKKYDISNMDIKDITAVEIQNYVNDVADQYSYTGLLKMMRIVTAPLSKAAALHQIQANPCVGIEIPNREHIAIKPRDNSAYTPEEQQKLISILNLKSNISYYVILFMIDSGLRIGEALALEWKDVDFKRGGIYIHKTVSRIANKKQSKVVEGAKTFKSNRIIPVNDDGMALLKELKEKSSFTWVFADETGEHVSYEAVRYQTKKVCARAKIEYKGEHVFRHTFATNRFNDKVDIKILSKLLGHASTSITYDTYVNLYGDGFDDMKRALSS